MSGAGMATMPTPISASATRTVATRGQAGRFRSFGTGEAIPVLGESNLNQARREGFLCARR